LIPTSIGIQIRQEIFFKKKKDLLGDRKERVSDVKHEHQWFVAWPFKLWIIETKQDKGPSDEWWAMGT
jgi:hypothetical protein